MTNDLYIWVLVAITSILGVSLLYIWLKRFEVAFLFFAITPLISPFFFDNLPELETLTSTEATTGIGGYIRAVILLVLGMVGIITYLKKILKLEWKIPTHLFLLSIFIIFSFSSSYYSLDRNFTLIRAVLLLSVFGFLLGFHSWLQHKENIGRALNLLFVLAISIIVVTFIGMLVFPARTWWWKASRLIGFWDSPNNLGSFCMLVYPILIWKFYNVKNSKRFLISIPLIINILLHIFSGSRTTLLASFIGVILWLVLERSWIKLFFTTLFLGLSLIALVNFSPTSFSREENSKITNLSSRENIWESAFIFIEDRPIIGYGYGVEGKIFQDESKLDLDESFIEKNVRQSLHSGYLSILVGGGIVGLLLWIIILLFPFWIGLSVPFNSIKAYSIVTMVMVLITNFIESNLTGYSSATDIYFWIAWIIAGNLGLSFDDKTPLKADVKII
ncbi:MAG: O-antigen ligase family protein [Ignavibacteriae bacterium]|nr:O-antigen ligase family protein [Ignavibacteriota bacterium]